MSSGTPALETGPTCPNCGQPLSRQAPAGLCPRCLLEASLADLEAPEIAPIRPLHRVGGYELIGEIARGGMGVVWKARQVTLNRLVALKLIHGGVAAAPEFVQRFRTEAEAAAILDHPNIVPIYEVGEHDGQPFFSMKLVEGETLATRLHRDRAWFTPERSARLMAKLARAVHYAHQRGILHRDLKPANVLVDGADEPYLLDFGLAKLLDAANGLTVTRAVLGTPSYLSPEQAAGRSAEVTAATDVYGLGALLYELLTGQPPFAENTTLATLQRVLQDEPRRPTLLNPAVDRDLETLCLKCLEKDPQRRYCTAANLADELERWLRREPIEARPSTAFESAAKWIQRHPARAALAGTIATALVAISVISTSFSLHVAAESRRDRQQAVQLHLASGNTRVSAGDTTLALLDYVEAFRLDGGDRLREDVHRRRIGATLRQAPVLEQMWFHQGAVNTARFSQDGRHIVSASDDRTARCWDVLTGQTIGTPLRHPGAVTTAAFSPDGQRILTTCSDGYARVWNVASQQLLFPPVPENEFLFKRPTAPGAVLSSDGRLLACAEGRTVQIRDAVSGQLLGPPLKAEDQVNSVAFSPDGSRILAVCDTGQAFWWQTDSPESPPLRVALGGGAPGAWSAGCFSSDSKKVLVMVHSGEARIWDARTGKPLTASLRHESGARFLQAGFSPGGQYAYTLGSDRIVQLCSPEDGTRVGPVIESDPEIQMASFSRDNQRVALASLSGAVCVRRIQDGRLAWPRIYHTGFVFFTELSPDGTRLVTASQEGLVQIWREPGDVSFGSLPHPGRVASAQFSPNGHLLLTACAEGTAQLWSTSTWRRAGPSWEVGSEILQATFDPTGREVALACGDGTVRVWSVQSGRELYAPLRHEAPVRHLAFSPDGRMLVTITKSSDPMRSVARLWNASTGQALFPAIPHPNWLDWCEFSPDSRCFLTSCSDGYVRVFDSTTGRLKDPPLFVNGLAWEAHFSPDGRRVLAACNDLTYAPRSAVLFDRSSGRRLVEFSGHRDGVTQAIFSPDGQHVATGSEDDSARIWEPHSGQPVTPPLQHLGKLTRLAFSPDGRFLATASLDGTARLWDAATGDPITPPLRHDRAVRTLAFSPDGRLLLTAGDDSAARVWDISATPETLSALTAKAELLCSRRAQAAGPPAPLDGLTLDKLWLQQRH